MEFESHIIKTLPIKVAQEKIAVSQLGLRTRKNSFHLFRLDQHFIISLVLFLNLSTHVSISTLKQQRRGEKPHKICSRTVLLACDVWSSGLSDLKVSQDNLVEVELSSLDVASWLCTIPQQICSQSSVLCHSRKCSTPCWILQAVTDQAEDNLTI